MPGMRVRDGLPRHRQAVRQGAQVRRVRWPDTGGRPRQREDLLGPVPQGKAQRAEAEELSKTVDGVTDKER